MPGIENNRHFLFIHALNTFERFACCRFILSKTLDTSVFVGRPLAPCFNHNAKSTRFSVFFCLLLLIMCVLFYVSHNIQSTTQHNALYALQ
jgi:hypothetical protein